MSHASGSEGKGGAATKTGIGYAIAERLAASGKTACINVAVDSSVIHPRA